ncbi:MAG: hypothetical protein A2X94_10290 [Bdellovibrionales bacterium GWB1_55_8]|nr:MAG: hypothetical protein A2X94_10290 [Bdellovibrionales bacterium GWB1_55_8]
MKKHLISLLIPLLVLLGSATAVIASFHEQELVEQLKALSTPAECQVEISTMSNLLAEYDRAGERNRARTAKNIQKKIFISLQTAQQSRPICFKPLARLYAVGAVYLVGRDRFQNDYAAALSALANANLLEPVTAEMRAELGGLWLKDILGAYDCSETRIFFEPFQTPVNLGVTLIHELDHLLRDKLFNLSRTMLRMRDSILLDESLASLHGAYAGLRVTTELTYHRRWQWNPFQGVMETVHPFTFESDNNLYSKNGNLNKIWTAIPLDEGGFKHALSFIGFIRKTLVEYQMVSEYRNIFRVVEKTYFDGVAPRLSEMSFRTLSDFLSAHHTEVEPMELWFKENRYHSSLDPKKRKRFVSELSNPSSPVRRKSSSCELFERALANGELDDYLGNRLKPGTEGVRPGTEGVRPGTEGVRPSLTAQPCLKPSAEF